MGLFKQLFNKEKKAKLDEGLVVTKKSFFDKLSKAVVGKSKVDDAVLDELEEVLIASDVGVATTLKIIDRIEARVAKDKYLGTDELQSILREEIAGLLSEQAEGEDSWSALEVSSDAKLPFVIMVVGVNGVGKTTTIGKLAAQFKSQGLKVVLGAADTFRAAAIDQLQIWADRTQTDIVKQKWAVIRRVWLLRP
jgi:fused signal recognition particle receptor